MTLAHARALLPEAESPLVDDFRPEQDLAALTSLARWCTRLAPAVQADPPDGLLLDFAGCSDLYKGPSRIVRRVGGAMRHLGLRARVALAPTFACAWGTARYARHSRVIVLQSRKREAMGPLPIEALRLDPDVCSALREVAVDTVEQMLRLPRAQLASRFGPDALLRVDQAMGAALETIHPVRAPDPIRVERVLDGPCKQLEALQLCTRQLVEAACQSLAKRDSGARLFELRLARLGLPPETIVTTLSRPSRNPRHIFNLLCPMLDRAQLGYGVERLELSALRPARLKHRQAEYLSDAAHAPSHTHQERLGELVDALCARLGPDRVLGTQLAETHVPERACTRHSLLTSPDKAHAVAGVTPCPRPPILLEPARPVQVLSLVPEGPPTHLRIDGRETRLHEPAGPERIAHRWWLSGPAGPVRDYFRVRDDSGQWLWLYRELPAGRWFLQGLWA